MMVNLGKYSIHGSCGYTTAPKRKKHIEIGVQIECLKTAGGPKARPLTASFGCSMLVLAMGFCDYMEGYPP